jgi:hypothetical protein
LDLAGQLPYVYRTESLPFVLDRASQVKADRFPFPCEGDITLAVRCKNYALGPVMLHIVMKPGSAGPSVIVVQSWYDPHMPTPFGSSIRYRKRAADFLKTKCGYGVLR